MSPAAPGEYRSGTTASAVARLGRAVAIALLWVPLLGALAPAYADGASRPGTGDPPEESVPGTARTVGECTRAGQVWLVVVTDTDEVLRSECVGTPRTGRDALTAAGVAVTTGPGGYLCTLAGHPQDCPNRYDGTYWQYWHAEGPGTEWIYSQKGADEHRVAAGSIEGWCRNPRGERHCTPPMPGADEAATARIDREVDRPDSWPWIVAVAALVAGAAAVVRRTTRKGPAEAR
jgi:hypothetical protein